MCGRSAREGTREYLPECWGRDWGLVGEERPNLSGEADGLEMASSSRVILGKSFYLSVPRFPHL